MWGPFRLALMGNSLSGGGNVGGGAGSPCTFPWPQPQPTPQIHNPGDVPSKLKALADVAGEWNFSWIQNTRSGFYLRDHATTCAAVNERLLPGAQAVVLQGNSAEFRNDNCQPTQQQVDDANALLAKAPESSRVLFFESWASYNYSENNRKAEICFYDQVRCSIQTLVSKLARRVEVVPVGLAFRMMSDAACQKANPQAACVGRNLSFGGYAIDTCNATTWSLSGNGIFDAGDPKHQSEAAGAWLEALVLYGSLHTGPCLPNQAWLKALNVSLFAELTTVARAALQHQFGNGLPDCYTSVASSSVAQNGSGWSSWFRPVKAILKKLRH